jgi:hypothetical protein
METETVVHVGEPHEPVWVVDNRESVFGMRSIHAVLNCKVCKVRRPPKIFRNDSFDVAGDTNRTYTLKTGL